MTLKIKSIAATILLCFGIASIAVAQNSYANNQVKATKTSNLISVATENNIAKTITVSEKMEAKFTNMFPNATAQKWFEAKETYFVSFLNNGRKANASINAKGNLNYVITACNMEQLPKIFSKIIKSNYEGFQLFHASEITAYGATAYQAVIENTTCFITLKYTIDGVEEIQQVKK